MDRQYICLYIYILEYDYERYNRHSDRKNLDRDFDIFREYKPDYLDSRQKWCIQNDSLAVRQYN